MRQDIKQVYEIALSVQLTKNNELQKRKSTEIILSPLRREMILYFSFSQVTFLLIEEASYTIPW